MLSSRRPGWACLLSVKGPHQTGVTSLHAILHDVESANRCGAPNVVAGVHACPATWVCICPPLVATRALTDAAAFSYVVSFWVPATAVCAGCAQSAAQSAERTPDKAEWAEFWLEAPPPAL